LPSCAGDTKILSYTTEDWPEPGSRALAHGDLVLLILRVRVAGVLAEVDPEPVLPQAAGQGVGDAVVDHGGRVQPVRIVQPAAVAEVVDPGDKVNVRPRPLLQEGEERRCVRVVDGRAADEDVVAGAAVELISAEAADHDVATRSAGQGVAAGVADQHVVE